MNPWYETVPPETKLTQGDLVFDCPIIGWKAEPIKFVEGEELKTLEAAVLATRADVVVMTQACDLENEKVSDVILCPHLSLDRYKDLWGEEMEARGQTVTPKNWKAHCDDIRGGFIWNLSILNENASDEPKMEHRVVDFHYVYTVPRDFLESYLKLKNQPRLRIAPPYREHLSQAFARFFMRVGLPIPVSNAW